MHLAESGGLTVMGQSEQKGVLNPGEVQGRRREIYMCGRLWYQRTPQPPRGGYEEYMFVIGGGGKAIGPPCVGGDLALNFATLFPWRHFT
jgi:hypothetical protein